MQEKKPKILLTGGHLSPLLSVIEEMKRRADVVVAGRKHTFELDSAESLEYSLIKKMGIPFYDISASRLQRKFTRRTIPSFFKFPKSIFTSTFLIKKERPSAILTFGGYIGLPIALAARLQKIPVFLHEQTLEAGLTNKLISKFAKKIFISYPTSQKYFPPEKTVLTGNPLRPEIFEIKKTIEIPEGKDVLLILGGSSGSHRINLLIESVLEKLLSSYTVIHQTGDAQEFKDYDRLQTVREELSEKMKKHYIIKKFIEPQEIGLAYNKADYVISRAGANTISELIALQKRALLIPLPYSQNNEQRKNAEMMVSLNRGVILEEKNMDEATLLAGLSKLKNIHIKNEKVQENYAAKKISEEVLNNL